MKYTKRSQRIVAALVAFAMMLSLAMPVLAESGVAQSDEDAAAPSVSTGYGIYINDVELTEENLSKDDLTYDPTTHLLLAERRIYGSTKIRITGSDPVDVELRNGCTGDLSIAGARNVKVTGCVEGNAAIDCTGDLSLNNEDGYAVEGVLTVTNAQDVTVSSPKRDLVFDTLACTGKVELDVLSIEELSGVQSAEIGSASKIPTKVTISMQSPGRSIYGINLPLSIISSGTVTILGKDTVADKLEIEQATDVVIEGSSYSHGREYNSILSELNVTCSGKLEIQNTSSGAENYVVGKLCYTPMAEDMVLRAGASAEDENLRFQSVFCQGEETSWKMKAGNTYLCAAPETLYDITVIGGSASVNGNGVTRCPAGETVQLKPNQSKGFLGWQVDAGTVTIDTETNTFTMPAEKVELTGQYEDGSIPDPDPEPDPNQPEQFDYPYLLLHGEVPITPDNLEEFNGFVQYDGATATYTLKVESEAESEEAPQLVILGVAAKDGTLPSIVLACSTESAIFLGNLNDVTVNGDTMALVVYPEDESATVNSVTVNGNIRYGAFVVAEKDIVVHGSVVTETMEYAEASMLYSTQGNVELTLDAECQTHAPLTLGAPNGGIWLTGENSEKLTAENAMIRAIGGTLYAVNNGSGKVGDISFTSETGSCVVTVDGEPLEVEWESPGDGYVSCQIAAEDSGNTLIIVPEGMPQPDPERPKPEPDPEPDQPGTTDPTDPTDPEQPAETSEESVGSVIMTTVAVAAAGGAVLWGGYELVTRAILNNILPEGAAIPTNRGELAMLAWQTAGKPEPAAQPAFADITDPELAKAAQWCVEQGMLEGEGSFRPEDRMAKFRVIEAWKKAF